MGVEAWSGQGWTWGRGECSEQKRKPEQGSCSRERSVKSKALKESPSIWSKQIMRKCWQVLKTCQGPDSARPWHAQLRILVFIQKNGTKLRMVFKYQGDMIIPAF